MSSPDLLVDSAKTDAPLSAPQRVVVWISVFCLLVGMFLRLAAAMTDYLWLDELHTGWAVSGRFSDVYWRSVDGNQSPLFFWMCFAAVKLLGYSAGALRAVSLAGSILLMVGLPLVVYRASRCAAAVLLISVFLMLDYDCIFYASEARPYAMLQWLGGLQAMCFWRWSKIFSTEAEETGRSFGVGWLSSWLVVSLLSAAVVFTHITGAWLLLAEAVFMVFVCLTRRKWPSTEVWKCAALFLVLSLPALLAGATAWQRRGNWASVSNVDLVVVQFAWAFGAMVLLPALVLAVEPLVSSLDQRDCNVSRLLLVFVGIWALVPTLAIVVLDRLQVAPLGITRYAVIGSIAFPLFAALSISRMKSKVSRWATVVIVAGFLIWNSTDGLRAALPLSGLRNENWADAVATIADGDPGWPVLLAGNVLEDVDAGRNQSPRFQEYLKFPVLGADPKLKNPILPLNSQGELFTEQAAAAVEAAAGGWLIVRDRPQNVPLILDLIDKNPQSRRWQFDFATFPAPVPNYVLLFRIRRLK